eukprot:COSAG06_NODE_2745_length_6354_cov_59.692246_5_plen_309_part_00
MRGWFAFGGGCTECPEGEGAQLLAPVLGVVASISIIVGVWKLSATPEIVEDAKGARENAETVVAIQGQVNNAVAFFGITAFHLQLSAINLSVPGFPFPGLLRAIARWMSNMFGFDIGTAAAPECNFRDEVASGIILLNTKILYGTVAFVMLAVWMYGKCKGRRNHARNAMLATYTLVVSALVETTTSFVDCTDDGTGTLTYDAMPSVECRWEWEAVVIFGPPGLVSCVIMPLVFLWALRRKTEKVPFCLCCKCFDSPDKGEPFSYAASYAWVTRKYTPSHQWFEVAFIGYKVVTAFTSSEYASSDMQD